MSRFKYLLGDLALLACAIIWGTTFMVTRHAVAFTSPVLFTAARFSAATLVLAPLVLRTGFAPLWRARWWSVAIGLLIALGFSLQTWGLRTIGASRSAFLTVLYVFVTIFVEWIVLRKRPRRSTLAGAVLAVAGVGVMTDALRIGTIDAGDAVTLAAAVVFGVQMVVLSAALKRFPSRHVMPLELATCAIVCYPAAALADAPPHFEWNVATLGGIAYLAVIATVLVFGLQNYGQSRTTASHASVMFSSEPVWAAVFGALFAGERLAANEVLGGALVLAGLLVATVIPRLSPKGINAAPAQEIPSPLP